MPASDLAGVEFLDAETGIAVTSSWITCDEPAPGGGIATGKRMLAVRLLRSVNAGQSWVVTGSTTPSGISPTGAPDIALAFVSSRWGWVESGGHLDETTDGGDTWHADSLDGRPVVALGYIGDSIFAVTSGPWRLWQRYPNPGNWNDVGEIPTATHTVTPEIIIGPGPGQLLVASQEPGLGRSEIAETTDGGRRWSVTNDPCTLPTWIATLALVEAPDGTEAVLCGGSGAAGSGPRGFYVSSSRGASWNLRAAVTDLQQRNPGALPLSDWGDVLAAENRDSFFLCLGNGLAATTDGGPSWENVGGVGQLDRDGAFAKFDDLDAQHTWLLVPGAGLFRSANRGWSSV